MIGGCVYKDIDDRYLLEKQKEGILSRIIQLEYRLGCSSIGLLDLYCAGFSREEIYSVWDDLVWLYGPGWDGRGVVDVEVLEQANKELQVVT